MHAALGALITILDPGKRVQEEEIRGEEINELINDCRSEYNRVADNYPKLKSYVARSVESINAEDPGTFLSAKLMNIFYHILNYEPFLEWQENPLEIERAERLGVITQVLERYTSIPYKGNKESDRGGLRTSKRETRGMSVMQLIDLYYMLFGSLALSGKLDQPEDDEIICPPGTEYQS